MAQFETAINLKCPNANIKAIPHIESKMRRWKKDYAIVYDMVNKTGFAWNDVRKCIEVDSTEVWQSYVKVNKEVEGWLGKSFPLYDRLNVIFGKDRATEVGAATSTEMMNEPEHINEDEDEAETSSPSVARRSSSSSTRKRKRATNDNDLALAFKEMLSESVDKLGEVLQVAFGKGVDPKPEIVSELSKMDLSIDDQIKALNILFEKPQNKRTFSSLDGAMKKAFVLMLLGQSNPN
ncbi:uncharacterized protein LOC108867582 [Pyrus x bretschneideri]|uniref:uncharacterized protein LOC108867582 n=1 Tax=Pyrus x bretschneideri TaxID=225117 RepID=UPI0020309F1C|nr:uncharacterized protein LOC108867582 [Pyrus x bretschneideri]